MVLVSGCATPPSLYRQDALVVWEMSPRDDLSTRFPDEYRRFQADLSEGERLFNNGKVTEADSRYQEAIRLGKELTRQRKAQLEQEAIRRQQDEERRRAEIRRLEEERRLKEIEAERLLQAQREAQQVEVKEEVPRETLPKPATYTVKRGETLPQIAARTMIYGDSSLWPLIYRANRDQIRDPRRLWPGQILRIPRNPSKDDIAEARRFAQEKQMP